MRYVFAILLCLLGAWVIYSSQTAPPERQVEWTESNADDADSLDSGSSSESNPADKDGKAIKGLSVPTTSDPLAATIHEILMGLVEDKLGPADRGELETKMTNAMLAEKLGDAETLGSASRSAIDKMLREAESARAAGAGGGTMTAFQMQATIAMAGRMAGSLRRAMRASRDGTVHDGKFFSVDFDFDVPEEYTKAGWEIIGGFRYVEGMDLPKSVTSLHQKKVGIAGYMMALGEFEDIHIFAVVESQWSCCFGTPPDIHQVVEVTIADADPGIELVAVPILVLGTIDVGEISEDGWVISVYRMKADSVDVLE